MVYHMNRLTGGAIALLCVVSSAPALSQGVDGLSFSGDLEFEHTRFKRVGGTVAAGTMFLRYDGPVGLELGAEFYEDLEAGEGTSLPYAALSLGIGPGELALGAPQPVGDMLVEQPVFAGLRSFQEGFDARGAGIGKGVAAEMARADGERLLGVRVLSEGGPLRWGVSAHQITEQSGTHWQAAAEVTLGSGTEIEGFVQGEDNDLGATLGATVKAGKLDMGVYLSTQHVTAQTDAATAFVGFSLNEQLSLRAHARVEDGLVRENLMGVSAEYGFGTGAFAQFGAADGNQTSMTVDASVGIRF